MALINGTENNDVLLGTPERDVMHGLSGDDRLFGGEGNDVIWGENGIDRLHGEGGDDALHGGGGRDLLWGGAGNDRLVGLLGIDELDGGSGADVMEGGDGADLYFIDDIGDVVIEQAGTTDTDTVRSSVSYTMVDLVENLFLMGDDDLNATGHAGFNIIHGNSGNNVLLGAGGNDQLYGEGGDDVLEGGEGNDALVGLTGSDILLGGQGDDDLFAGYDERADTMDGGEGNDSLEQGGIGDTLRGGAGNDTYHVLNGAGVILIEAAGAGTDLVSTFNSFALGDNFENLSGLALGNGETTLEGNALANIISASGAVGSEGLVHIYGNGGDDTLSVTVLSGQLDGGSGNDRLLGGQGQDHLLGGTGNDRLEGGAGNDIMEGGNGSDTYIVSDAGDTLIELGEPSFGVDLVQSSISWTLGADFENLTLIGAAKLAGTGNEKSNDITGNSGNNILSGKAGNDFLYGNAGNDTLVGGTGDDFLIAGDGNDTARGGTGHDHVSGGGGDDLLEGDSGNDELYGGLGNDTLIGGGGNDTYFFNSVAEVNGDTIIEGAGGGNDEVFIADMSWTLAEHLEDIHLVIQERFGSYNAIGNSANNRIDVSAAHDTPVVLLQGLGGDDYLDSFSGTLEGGEGNDQLRAHGLGTTATMDGGTGNDRLWDYAYWDGDDEEWTDGGGHTMTGGAGSDEFRFSHFSENISIITDFHGDEDSLNLEESSLFEISGSFPPPGGGGAQNFHAGTAAQTADHRFIYDAGAGALYYDADGSGAAAQHLILHINVVAGTFNHQDINVFVFEE